MNHRITALFASAAALTLSAGAAFAQTAPAAPPVLLPAMSSSLAADSSPLSFDLGVFGSKVYVTGALTGMAQTEDHPIPGDEANQADIDNAQIIINKPDGMVQYFVQIGNYGLPSLGYPYVKSGPTTSAAFGIVPQGFVKLAPTSSFSVEVGKLPTLIGAEYTFSYENLNIERGLLWAFEPAVSRGVQANYASGPLAVSVSWNDGLYSNQYNTISGLGTWTIDPTNILAVAVSGTTKKTSFSALNNQTIVNVLYTHTMGPWTFNPYFQYSAVPKYIPAGVDKATTIYGYALLMNYVFDSKSMLAGVSLPVRGEYINSTGGLKTSGYSLTFTPTYQYKIYFIRGEVSYTSVGNTDFIAFGNGSEKSQTRGLIETGILF
jgi:hypothetical protein